MTDHSNSCAIVTSGVCTCNGLPIVEWHRHDKDVTYRPDSIVIARRDFEKDAAAEWVVHYGIGGWVCSECGMPVESEPCEEHQPLAYGAMT